MNERTAYLIGWLEGFSGSIWAMCNVQEREVVAPESVAEYEEKVKELREALEEVIYPMGSTVPYIVETMPLSKQSVDKTPKITFTAKENS